jgi:hypothetical protein
MNKLLSGSGGQGATQSHCWSFCTGTGEQAMSKSALKNKKKREAAKKYDYWRG